MAICSFTHTHKPTMTNWTTLTIVCESYSLLDCSVGGLAGFYIFSVVDTFRTWLVQKNLFWTGKEDRRTWWFWSTVRRARRRRLALIDNDAPSKRLDQISSISDQGLSGAFVMCLYRRHGRRSAESADAPNSIDTSKILREREKSPGKERSKAGRRTCADRCCLCVCVARLLFNS
jgi:hypothetical protein